MTEPNLGISRVCFYCKKSYWCTDGDFFCSDKCYDEWERLSDLEEENEEEVLD